MYGFCADFQVFSSHVLVRLHLRYVFRYNEVLANGLPDWRQPIYYYRRVRRMGLLEFSVLLSIILTTGHFITIWSMYLEKRFEKVGT